MLENKKNHDLSNPIVNCTCYWAVNILAIIFEAKIFHGWYEKTNQLAFRNCVALIQERLNMQGTIHLCRSFGAEPHLGEMTKSTVFIT